MALLAAGPLRAIHAAPQPYPDLVTCHYVCPGGAAHTVSWDGEDATACDPSFITRDRTWTALKQVANDRGRVGVSQTLSGGFAEVGKALTKALDEAKAPDRAWSVAMEAWRSSVSSAFQRQALALVRSMAKPPADAETLNFMLSALENPAAAMDRCRELGRGTALERKKAADRLALLLQNPNLADRLK